jgi:hypothetical protein
METPISCLQIPAIEIHCPEPVRPTSDPLRTSTYSCAGSPFHLALLEQKALQSHCIFVPSKVDDSQTKERVCIRLYIHCLLYSARILSSVQIVSNKCVIIYDIWLYIYVQTYVSWSKHDIWFMVIHPTMGSWLYKSYYWIDDPETWTPRLGMCIPLSWWFITHIAWCNVVHTLDGTAFRPTSLVRFLRF